MPYTSPQFVENKCRDCGIMVPMRQKKDLTRCDECTIRFMVNCRKMKEQEYERGVAYPDEQV